MLNLVVMGKIRGYELALVWRHFQQGEEILPFLTIMTTAEVAAMKEEDSQ
jgi:hypothetical protein